MEAIRRAVGQFREVGRRFLNKDIVDSVIEANGPLFDELGRLLAREKLFDLTRRVMKSAAEMTESAAQLDLGLNAAGFEMPSMIAVPVDPGNPLNGDCEWVPVTEATVADLDANLGMLDLQIEADRRKRRNVFLLRQRVVSLVGEDSALTVAQAAAMARELQPA
jgi:hypothetical protein